MKKPLLIAALAAATTVSPAHADQRWPLWYVGLSGGVTFLDEADISGAATGSVDFDTGGIGTLALGYMPPSAMQPFSNMRFELEGGYHYNKLDSLVLGGTPTATNGSIRAVSYMGNVYYDFRNNSRFTPYLGAGAGGAHVKLSRTSGIGNTGDSDNVFAYQFMGGIGYAPTALPMTEWTLGYRYFTAQSPDFGNVELDDYRTHNVELGGRFRF